LAQAGSSWLKSVLVEDDCIQCSYVIFAVLGHDAIEDPLCCGCSC